MGCTCVALVKNIDTTKNPLTSMKMGMLMCMSRVRRLVSTTNCIAQERLMLTFGLIPTMHARSLRVWRVIYPAPTQPFAVGILGLLAGCDLFFDSVGRQCGTLLALWKAMWDSTCFLEVNLGLHS